MRTFESSYNYSYTCNECKQKKTVNAFHYSYHSSAVCNKCKGAKTKNRKRATNSRIKEQNESHFEFDNADEIPTDK